MGERSCGEQANQRAGDPAGFLLAPVHRAYADIAPRIAGTRYHKICLRQQEWCPLAYLVPSCAARWEQHVGMMRTKCRRDPTDPVEATKKLANSSEVLCTRQDQTRPNTEPGRGFFFLGSLPHLAPRAWGDPRGQPQGHLHRLFCFSGNRAGERHAFSRTGEELTLESECFNTTALRPKNSARSPLPSGPRPRPGAVLVP
jgi:hypothetical protein